MFIPGLSSGGESGHQKEKNKEEQKKNVQSGGQEQHPLIPQLDIFLGNNLSVPALTS